MPRKDLYDNDCPLLYALNIIGGKWRIPIIWYLQDGSLRYNQLKRKLNGITNTMLTRTLQDLESHGLVKRIQYAEIPPHVEYLLTDHAKQLIPVIMTIQEWGEGQFALEHVQKA
ncbi:MAG: hypothetical protein PWP38_3049 [Clostridiales bacterium]|jgi:DNA-binding HxlR family transcriptional regulator|nr:hypothetical protein [Clostridiales bacterium]